MESLFEGNFRQNSTKTIRLFALDFYELIADSAFDLINYHLIEISSLIRIEALLPENYIS